MRTSGFDDSTLVEDSTDAEITDTIGWLRDSSHNITNSMETRASVNSGASNAYHVDKLANLSGSQEYEINSLEGLKIFGTLTTGSISFDDILPTNTVKTNTDDSNYLEFTGVKFGSFSLNIARGETITLSVDWKATGVNPTSGTISPTEPSSEPETFLDVYVKIGGTVVGSLDSITIDYDRDTEHRRGIEEYSSGEKRLATHIKEMIKSISADVSIEVEDQTAWEQVMSTSSGIEDSRSDTSLSVELATNSETLSLTGFRANEVSEDKTNDGDVRTADLTGTALGMSVTGL